MNERCYVLWLAMDHLCKWRVPICIIAEQKCLTVPPSWPNSNDKACPSPLSTMPIKRRTISPLFHNCLHFFLTKFWESEAGNHVMACPAITSVYYFKWEKQDAGIYTVSPHLHNFSQPKVLYMHLNIYVWLLKHDKSVDGYIFKNCTSYLQEQGHGRSRRNRAEIIVFSLYIFGCFFHFLE